MYWVNCIQKLMKILPKILPKPIQMSPEIDPKSIQGPLGAHFRPKLNLERPKTRHESPKSAPNRQLGPKVEAPEGPKSRPKPEKSDVRNQHVFGIDFGRVRTSFWKGFW